MPPCNKIRRTLYIDRESRISDLIRNCISTFNRNTFEIEKITQLLMISLTSCCMISGIKFTDNLFRFPSLFSSDEDGVSMPWRACCLIDVDFGLRNVHSEPCDIVRFSGSMLRFLSPLERLFEAASTILESAW